MTLAIAARFTYGIVCMTDTKVSYGTNSFDNDGIKGYARGTSFIMWAGDVWACQKAILDRDDEDFLAAVKACAKKHSASSKHPDFPAEFIEVNQVTDQIRIIDGDGARFPKMAYAVIGHGSLQGWGLMEALYKGGSLTAVKRQLGKVLRITAHYDNTVNSRPDYKVIWNQE